jgi:hypothetical protein
MNTVIIKICWFIAVIKMEAENIFHTAKNLIGGVF